MSKTANVGINTRRFITFLDEQGTFSNNETQELLQQCTLMADDLKRCQRVKWLVFQHELFFEPRLGGRPRLTAFQGSELKGNIYEVADIGENFILADMCGQGGTCLLAFKVPNLTQTFQANYSHRRTAL
jgi:hypothetical protein